MKCIYLKISKKMCYSEQYIQYVPIRKFCHSNMFKNKMVKETKLCSKINKHAVASPKFPTLNHKYFHTELSHCYSIGYPVCEYIKIQAMSDEISFWVSKMFLGHQCNSYFWPSIVKYPSVWFSEGQNPLA